MPNECWLRCEALLTKSEADPRTVTCPASTSGPCGGTRRELSVREAACINERHRSPAPHIDTVRPRGASPLGSVVASEQALVGWTRDAHAARPIPPSVAPFGVNAFTRLSHPHRALRARRAHTYEVPRNRRCRVEQTRECLRPSSGTGAPALILQFAACSSP